MDASEHEYPSMSRHNRRVPTSFYSRFARDLNSFASAQASYSARPTSSQAILPKIVSILEGGYSDRALASATASFLAGLATDKPIEWDLTKDIIPLEKAVAASQPSTNNKKPLPDYLVQTAMLYDLLTGEQIQRSDWQKGLVKEKEGTNGQAMRLRDRTTMKAPAQYAEEDDQPSAAPRIKQKKAIKPIPVIKEKLPSPIPLPQVPVSTPASLPDAANGMIFAAPQPSAPTSISQPAVANVVPLQSDQPTTAAAVHEPVKPTATQADESATTAGPKLKLVWRSQGIE